MAQQDVHEGSLPQAGQAYLSDGVLGRAGGYPGGLVRQMRRGGVLARRGAVLPLPEKGAVK